jgi:hypothetical protein
MYQWSVDPSDEIIFGVIFILRYFGIDKEK